MIQSLSVLIGVFWDRLHKVRYSNRKNNKVVWVSWRCSHGSLCLLGIDDIVCTFTKTMIWVNPKPTTLVFLCLFPLLPSSHFFFFFDTRSFYLALDSQKLKCRPGWSWTWNSLASPKFSENFRRPFVETGKITSPLGVLKLINKIIKEWTQTETCGQF